MNEKAVKLTEDRAHFEALRDGSRSLIMATLGGDEAPLASYAPFVLDAGCFYVYLSRLSEHTANLLQNPAVSVLLIEDEAPASQIFARKRATYRCESRSVQRDDRSYDPVLERFSRRFGSVMVLLQSLPDFVLFRLRPVSGRFVTGFGRAYDLAGEALDELVHVGPDDASG